MRHELLRSRLFLPLIASLLGAGCSDPCDPSWSAVTEEADGAVLSVWGASDDDVVAVGGGLGVAGQTALALHWDGRAWARLDTGGRSETLWWVWGAPGGGDVWMVGENGLALRWDGASVTTVETGTTAKLWGVWGTADDDVWIVGGMPGDETPDDVVLHFDGRAISPDATVPARRMALFKVWGSSDGLWVSGEAGTVLRRTAAGWEDRSAELATTASLFTVHGCAPDDVYVVGGTQVWRWDGRAFHDLAAHPGAPVNGVSCGADEVLVVGSGSVKMRLDKASGRWSDEQLAAPQADFHGAWISPDGRGWAVGGDFLTPPSALSHRPGTIAFHGCDPPPGP